MTTNPDDDATGLERSDRYLRGTARGLELWGPDGRIRTIIEGGTIPATDPDSGITAIRRTGGLEQRTRINVRSPADGDQIRIDAGRHTFKLSPTDASRLAQIILEHSSDATIETNTETT